MMVKWEKTADIHFIINDDNVKVGAIFEGKTYSTKCVLRTLASSEGFLHFSQNALKHIFLSNIRNQDEFVMFEACMHWAKTKFDG